MKKKRNPEQPQQESLWEKTAKTLDLPADLMPGLPRIQVVGGKDVLLENHKGILSYDETEISVNGGRVIVKFVGSALELRAMNAQELRLYGRLSSIEFIY